MKKVETEMNEALRMRRMRISQIGWIGWGDVALMTWVWRSDDAWVNAVVTSRASDRCVGDFGGLAAAADASTAALQHDEHDDCDDDGCQRHRTSDAARPAPVVVFIGVTRIFIRDSTRVSPVFRANHCRVVPTATTSYISRRLIRWVRSLWRRYK